MENKQLEVEDIAAAGVEDVDAGDVLPPLLSVDEVLLAGYNVGPIPLSCPRLTSSHHKLFVVVKVLELVKDWLLRSAQVALKFGHTGGSCYSSFPSWKMTYLRVRRCTGKGVTSENRRSSRQLHLQIGT